MHRELLLLPNGSSASNSSSCVVVGGKLDTNIAPHYDPTQSMSPAAEYPYPCPCQTPLHILVYSMYMRENDVRAPFVRLYEYARDLGRMSALTVFGGRPICVTVIVDEENWSVWVF